MTHTKQIHALTRTHPRAGARARALSLTHTPGATRSIPRADVANLVVECLRNKDLVSNKSFDVVSKDVRFSLSRARTCACALSLPPMMCECMCSEGEKGESDRQTEGREREREEEEEEEEGLLTNNE